MKRFLYILLLAFTATLYASCTGIGADPADDGKAMVNIVVSTRSGSVKSNDGQDTNAVEHEGIKDLRIIVLDENWKIIENWYQEGIGDNTGMTETCTVSLLLPRTKVRFLAIANENSMGRSFDTASLMSDSFLDYEANGLKEIFNRAWDDQPSAFPKKFSEIADYGLPMTGVKGATDVNLKADGNTAQDYNESLYKDTSGPIDLTNVTIIDIEIPLIRCVSKIVVKVTNLMDKDLTVENVNFGWFFANKVYYYAHDPLHLPYYSDLKTWNVEVNQKVTSKTSSQTIFTGYFFPVELANDNRDHNYVIALETGLATNEYKPFLLKEDTSGTTKIGRNKLVNINCTVNLQGLSVQTDLDLVVKQWDNKENMEIEFN